MHLMKNEDDTRGFCLDPLWQGLGLMSESCVAANNFRFGAPGMTLLHVPKAAANTASCRISQRQGMRMVAMGERGYACGRLPSRIWEITAEEWRVWRGPQPKQASPA